jgi:class 3 adenylate cyclase/YHS domain-containing protein
MPDGLSLEELSSRTGEPPGRLKDWRLRRLIGQSDAFTPEDVERIRLVQLLIRRGIALDAVETAQKEQNFIDHFLAFVFPQGVKPVSTLAAAAEAIGLDLHIAHRFWEAAGLGDQGDMAYEEDVAALETAKNVLDAGFPEEALLQVIRVSADTLNRVAEVTNRAFHFYVHERLKASGLSREELLEAVQAVRSQTALTVEPSILYFLRKGAARAVREDMVIHAAEEAGLIKPPDVPGQLTRAIAFVDLSSFTPLTAEMGDLRAAQVLERFSLLVRASTLRWDGKVVKQIGDAFMLVFPDSRSAVAGLLEIDARAAKEGDFPAVRSGLHFGDVLYRDGDYIGSVVNVAARLASEAERHQILVTADVRTEAHDLGDVEFVRLGKRKLKGLAGALALFAVRSNTAPREEKLIDPVCGMELGAAEIAASLTLDGVERAFCSDDCLRKFVVAPEQYTASNK